MQQTTLQQDPWQTANVVNQRLELKGKSIAENANRATNPAFGNTNKHSATSPSETTIYKRALPRVAKPPMSVNNTEMEIEQFIQNVRDECSASRKVSSSSDELMDTSDETANIEISGDITDVNFITGGKTKPDGIEVVPPATQADVTIREAEKSKARLFEVSGKELCNFDSMSVSQMDQDYQMIDSHIDEVTKQKIQNLEYVDFSKLTSRNRFLKDSDDQRMEIVNRNGYTFLAPLSERDSIQINSYNKWKEAFRVFSNILTTKYPDKSTELLQYNHTIHTASTSYVWENVYTYDREFRHHIQRHPSRSWAIILQQAWAMILKDRLKNDNSVFQKGNWSNSSGKNNKRDREPCRRFNKGRCTFGLSCRYDHRCSVPKCGKFGHGAHVCRMRETVATATGTPASSDKEGTAMAKTN